MRKTATAAILVALMTMGVPAFADVLEGDAPVTDDCHTQVLGVQIERLSGHEQVVASAVKSSMHAAKAAALEGTG